MGPPVGGMGNLKLFSVIFTYLLCIYGSMRVNHMVVMDKIEGDVCPRCGQKSLDVYYEEGSDLQLGAHCEVCGLKGFFMNGKLVPLATT